MLNSYGAGPTTKLDSVIVRFGGEIGIKSEWTRRSYENLLLTNIYRALKHYNIAYDRFIQKRGRIYVRTNNPKEIASKLTRVFGISSVSPAKETTSDMNDISEAAVQQASNIIKSESTFAVRCHRVGTHTYTSMDICKEVGGQILTRLKKQSLRVDLTDPQFIVNVEVRAEQAYIFGETLKGPGGFPVGSQSKVVCLLSGGIDSPVACWLAMKRGCSITPIYFDNTPLTDEPATNRALETAKALFEWSIGYPRKVYIVPHGRNLQAFVEKSPRNLTCILCKRMMYRVAERIADIENAEGIVTGEAIGEQASQTLTNLMVLNEAAAKYPIHRPLLGFDKTDTTELAERIGTFEISTRKAGKCSAAPNKPATKAKLETVRKAEEEVDIEQMVKESVQATKIMNL
jgi:thiamine biosynthesis protein ThiI